jgi:hypothetical protein
MERLMHHYRRITVFLDNDPTGWAAMYKYRKAYGEKISMTFIPKCLGLKGGPENKPIKDPTDLYAWKGADTALRVTRYALEVESSFR